MSHELDVMAEQCSASGTRGVVCAAAPLAAQAGLAAIQQGGNAYDAAICAALVETVVLPPKCGLGGDLIALAVQPGNVEPEALIAVGGAPAGLAAVAERGTWDEVGPMSVGPPAAAAGYAALADRGRLGRDRLARPAIELATSGFPWASVCTRLSEQAAVLVATMNPDGCVYYPGERAIAPGTITRLPGLARALEEFVDRGAAFLDGPVGTAVVDAVRRAGGVLTEDDFAYARADRAACVSATIASSDGDVDLWATPAPTHGPSLLEVMSAVGPTPTPASLFTTVMAAIGRRRGNLADPSGTSMVSAADADGNVVVIVHSNSFPRFGSGIVVPEYDLTLANRAGRGFTPERGHPNFPVAGRRPATTLHAWAVGGIDGRPRFVGATPGGANQMPWNAQTIARIAAGEHRPGMLVTSPIWEWLPEDDGLRIESGFDPTEVAALREATSRSIAAPRWGCKSAQQVIRIPRGDEPWVGAADPRTVGAAVGVCAGGQATASD